MAPQCRAGGLNCESAGHLTHGRKQRKSAKPVCYSFIGNCRAAGFHQPFGLVRIRIRRQMEICEENLVFSQLDPFGWLRFLHLHYHLAGRKNFASRADNACASLSVVVVGSAHPVPCRCLHRHRMTDSHILTYCRGREANAIFMRFDFLGNADLHHLTSLLTP
jgi:hypothetical protein